MPPTEHPLTILVVDDDMTLVDVLSRVLKRDGHTVVQGNGVAEALELADAHTPDLALIDLSLPDGDGVSLADRLRERHPNLPLILMTAYPIRAREDPAIASRFTRVMIKPLNLEELRRAVRDSLRGEPVSGASVPALPSVAAAPSLEPARVEAGESSSASPPTPRTHDQWHWLKSGAMVVAALVVLAIFLVYISGVPIPGLSAGAEATASPPPPLGVDLVKDLRQTLVVPDDVKKALGIRKLKREKDASGKEVEVAYDDVYTAEKPTKTRPLILTGSTALDPNEILHVRVRFTPAKVVRIGPADQDPLTHENRLTTGGVPPRDLRVGDHVNKGDLLGVFFSDVVGSQKNALFDAESQRRLDQNILNDARASAAAVKTFIDNAERNVEADTNHANQAANTLRTWGIPEPDIQKIIDEAKTSRGDDTRIGKEKYEEWGRVEVRSDTDGILVERNIPQNELIQDPTISLFQIAKVNNVQVIANASEDDLKILVVRQQAGQPLQWRIETVNGPDPNELFAVDDIGYIVDTNQHSAVVKGYIPNPGGKMRGAQIVKASIPLDPPTDPNTHQVNVVEIDVSAVADDGSGHTYVFVQTDEKKSQYTLRRMKVTHRFDKVVYVKSKLDDQEAALTPEEKEQDLAPLEELHDGDKVLTSGVLELKAELEDREPNVGK